MKKGENVMAWCEEVFCLALRENKREEAGRKWKSPDSLG